MILVDGKSLTSADIHAISCGSQCSLCWEALGSLFVTDINVHARRLGKVIIDSAIHLHLERMLELHRAALGGQRAGSRLRGHYSVNIEAVAREVVVQVAWRVAPETMGEPVVGEAQVWVHVHKLWRMRVRGDDRLPLGLGSSLGPLAGAWIDLRRPERRPGVRIARMRQQLRAL